MNIQTIENSELLDEFELAIEDHFQCISEDYKTALKKELLKRLGVDENHV